MEKKQVQLNPEKSHYFWQYVWGFILIPFFGAGLYLLYRIQKKRENTVYIVTDDTITKKTGSYSENIDLINITNITVNQSKFNERFDIGTLRIHTSTRSLKLEGLKNPYGVSNLILKAAEAERARIAEAKRPKPKESQHPPGTLDRLDYLTGLWQQGLLSDEDYQKEQKYFKP